MRNIAIRMSSVALMAGALSLGGCATTGSVKRAQAAADAAGASASHAQGSADSAGSAASAAADAAAKAQAAADAAGTSAGGAATDAQKANARLDALEKKVRWLSKHHRAGKAHKGKWHKKTGKKC